MMELRWCPYCDADKLFDPDPFLRNDKASGFYGTRCWDCYCESNKEANRRHRATPEGREKHNEHMRRRRKPAPWADKEAIKAIEAKAKAQGLSTNHKVPIKGVDPKTGIRVSGLHVEYNLEIVPLEENLRRGRNVDLEAEAQRIMAKAVP